MKDKSGRFSYSFCFVFTHLSNLFNIKTVLAVHYTVPGNLRNVSDFLIIRCIPFGEPIDLINVAFEQKNAGKQVRQRRKQNDDQKCNSDFEVPDRITGRSGVNELKQINPKRTWNFVEVYLSTIYGYIMIVFLFFITNSNNRLSCFVFLVSEMYYDFVILRNARQKATTGS